MGRLRLGGCGDGLGAAYGLRFILFRRIGAPAFRDVAHHLFIVLAVFRRRSDGAGLYRPRRDNSFLLELGPDSQGKHHHLALAIVHYYRLGALHSMHLALFLPLLIAGLILGAGQFYRSALRFCVDGGW